MQATKSRNLTLPPVSLKELPVSVKDYLIAKSATGKSVPEVIRESLLESARAQRTNRKEAA